MNSDNKHEIDNFIKQTIKKKDGLNIIKKKLIPQIPSICWGSAQYCNAYQMFILLKYLNCYYKLPWKILDIQISLGKVNKNALDEIKNEEIKYISNMIDNETKFYTDIQKKLRKSKNIDDLFEIKKLVGYDLWTTVNYIFSKIYKNNTITVANNNAIYQSLDNAVGLKCYILLTKKIVKYETSFDDFSS